MNVRVFETLVMVTLLREMGPHGKKNYDRVFTTSDFPVVLEGNFPLLYKA
jgi:hypothetical protein